MFDATPELLEKIALGEDSTSVLKEMRFAGERVTAPKRDALADELAAFANTKGGVCVLGIEDRMGRVDVPEFDSTAVFEALVNAVAHRDYAIRGSKIRLRMFADRLELLSPGPLANTMTVESLPLRQSARNEVITSLLARCPIPSDVPGLTTDRSAFMDKRGEGVSIILDRSEKLSGRRPEYRFVDDSELWLTIWAAAPKGAKRARKKAP